MKTNVLFFCLGVASCLTLAAATNSVQIFKHSKPIKTEVMFYGPATVQYNVDLAREYSKFLDSVDVKLNEGYVIKSSTISGDGPKGFSCLIVLELYE